MRFKRKFSSMSIRDAGYLSLQKNLRFEYSLVEEDAKNNNVSLTTKHSCFMQLLPLISVVRFVLTLDLMQEKKIFLFKLLDVVEGLDTTTKMLYLEETGIRVFEHAVGQEMGLSHRLSAEYLYGLSYLAEESPQHVMVENALKVILLKIYFLNLHGKHSFSNELLHKFKILVITSKRAKGMLNSTSAWSLARILRWKFMGSATLSLTKNNRLLNFISLRLLTRNMFSANSVKQFVWKRGSFSFNKYFSYLGAKTSLGIQALHSRDSSASFIYLLRRLEDKIAVSHTDVNLVRKLQFARNYLISLAEEHLHHVRQKNLLLSRTNSIRAVRRYYWKNLLVKIMLKLTQSGIVEQSVLKNILMVIFPHVASKLKPENVAVKGEVVLNKTSWQRTLREQRYVFGNKKIVEKESLYAEDAYTNLLSCVLGKETRIFFVNVLALTRFSFQGEGKGKNSRRFLQNIDREMVSRYKYVAVYIQDFVRVGFIALFLKKPTFLAQFMALQISKLPRNRKETKLVRFLIKVVKIFAAQRREVVGLRMLFKGRVNRWRRTKQIIGEKGVLPFQSINARIEFGSAKAITRKGTLGIRLWICYTPVFSRELRKSFVDYVEYSQSLRIQTLTRFLTQI